MPHETEISSLKFLLYRHGFYTHRHAALFCLYLSALPISGKEQTMKTPKTPIEFDYDLWTTEDGKCMVRVKRTGEVTEVDNVIMKTLRAEEKKLRRSFVGTPTQGGENTSSSVLSTDLILESASSWLADSYDFTEEVAFKMLEAKFMETLTPRERDVYNRCLKSGEKQSEYAKNNDLTEARVSSIVAAIKKKAKIFF